MATTTTRLRTALAGLALAATLAGAATSGLRAQTPETAASPAATPAATPPAATKLNLNTATEAEFLTIPGVGQRMVHEFEEYRPYESIEAFRREIGTYVDEEQVAAYEEHVYVPVDPNGADAATLEQLPGVDAEIAQQLIDGRPYDSVDAFLAELGRHVGADQVEAARALLATP